VRYELLTALAVAVAEAQTAAATHGALMVHEFLTDNRAGKHLAADETDLRLFAATDFGCEVANSDRLPWCVQVQSPAPRG
jgi:hypothetical protein